METKQVIYFSYSPQSTKAWPSHTMGQQGDRPRTEEEVILDRNKFVEIYHNFMLQELRGDEEYLSPA